MRKNLIILSSLLLTVGVVASFSFQKPEKQPIMITFQDENHEKEWKTIDSLENEGLPQSALAEVDKLYSIVVKENNPAQVIKCLIYKRKYQSRLEESGMVKAIAQLEKDMEQASFPVKSVLQSMLAELYQNYLSNNYWKFSNRTQTLDFKNEDIETWSIEQLLERSSSLYLLPLQDERTKSVELKSLDAVLTKGNDEQVRPTLFDFLAFRALDFFRNEQSYLTEPSYKFHLEDEKAFAGVAEFVKAPFSTRDSSARKFQALLLFQKVLAFHSKDAKPEALVDADLIRLKFVYENSILDIKGSLYEKALRQLSDAYQNHEVYTLIAHQLAGYYVNRGITYQPRPFWETPQEGSAQDQYKWDLKTAYELCADAIHRFPNTLGASQCKNLQSQIRSKNLDFQIEMVNLPDKAILGRMDYRNIQRVYLKVGTWNETLRQQFDATDWEKRLEFLNQQLPTKSWNLELPDDGDFRQHAVEFKIDALPLGHYVVMISDNPDFNDSTGVVNYLFTQVSNLAFVTQLKDGQNDYLVVNRSTGIPIEGVLAEFYQQDYGKLSRRTEMKKIGSARSDKDGRIHPELNERGSFKVKFSKEKDLLLSESWYSNGQKRYQPEARRQVFFFTDRAIYRPGQTVFFKLLAVEFDKNNLPKIIENEPFKVKFLNTNYQEVGQLELRSGEYGTANGSFVIPGGGLLGQMYLQTTHGQIGFRVEEYKRPKFEVNFEPVTGSFKLNEQVNLSGNAKAYAGSNIDGAKVVYRVTRRASFPFWKWWQWGWWNPWPTEEMEISNGETMTDEAGNFKISFDALPDRSIPKDRNPQFSYQISADVTDISGETQSGVTMVEVGYTALKITVDLPEQIDIAALDSLKINTLNLNNQPEQAQVQLTIRPLDAPGKVYLQRYWQKPDRQIMSKTNFEKWFPDMAYSNEDEKEHWPQRAPVLTKTLDTDREKGVSLRGVNWPQGAYLFSISTQDKFGNPVEWKQITTLTDLRQKHPAIPVVLENQVVESTIEPGNVFQQHLRTSSDKLCVFGILENRNQTLREGWISVEGHREINQPVTELDRGGFGYLLFAVHKNRLFQQNGVVTVPWSNKDLKIEFGTFRDKLQPGEAEEWQIKISGKKSEKVTAELVGTLYDASLDAFVPHHWSMNLFPTFYFKNHLQADNFWLAYAFTLRKLQDQFNQEVRQYRQLKWFGFNMYEFELKNMIMERRTNYEAREYDMAPAAAVPPEEAVVTANKDQATEVPDLATPSEKTPQPAKIRTNLNETVFFLPQLRTDADGNLVIKFKMNEALTRWKFLGFAHTPDLKFGLAQKELVTQKELMVLPNAPRFLREGDQIELTGKVSNLTNGNLEGQASLELFDPLTNQPIDAALENVHSKIPFSVKAGQSARLAWNLKIPVGKVQVVGYRMVVQSGSFSDGEESALPVLTNRMLVTETMPLPVRAGQTKDFVFQSLKTNTSNTLQHQRLTLEYTSNPAWYAVQALPYIMEYPYECTEQIFNRFYANSLATHVSNAHPKVKTVFDTWRNYQPEALKSNLSKNQELKTALLEETPWVLDAKNEEQQKQNIALLFDLNRMSYEMEAAIQKLADRQEGNGGWSWFPGGRPNWYITQYIVEGIGHLQRLGVRQSEKSLKYKTMIEKAVKYCDFELSEHYDALERNVKEGQTKWEDDHLDYMVIHYLYARSFFLPKDRLQAGGNMGWISENSVDFDDRMDKILSFYLGQAEKYWLNKGMYKEGMLALALQRFGKSESPARIVRSLKERALNHEELGMYWKYPKGWWWYQAPIETHALMIEVFQDVAKDERSVDDLKVWLLKNKQTTHWKTTKATAAAVYALLMSGDNWLLEDKPVMITFPLSNGAFDKKIRESQQSAEAGTGYFKTNLDGSEVNSAFATVKVTNPNKTVAWGGVYWQYFEQLDKIKTFEETPLQLKKEYFKVVLSDRGEVLIPVKTGEKLHPGQKIKVRIELRVDRDMEYVHMKDMRASGFEPINVLSQYKWQGGLGYYESTRDAATNFFIDYLNKGTYVFEYPLRVVHKGDFSTGITTIQSMYAPEFTSHSAGVRLGVD